ncbi:MAG: hypothetical protein M1820_003330 [Bogoriella megaspora]|nr:MAG: hypothetical protein M1820_003330 [Bogoriella megaspora]
MLQLNNVVPTIVIYLLCADSVRAQSTALVETVLASVLFVRTADHTPYYYGNYSLKLTSSGANQLWATGYYFRTRYTSGSTAIDGLSGDTLDNTQLFFLSYEDNLMSASMQAFVQGLYPPAPLTSEHSSPILDPSSILANESYISYPGGNYQYVAIGTTDDDDPTSIITAGSSQCPAWQSTSNNYTLSQAFKDDLNASQPIYQTAGSALLDDILDPTEWNYNNAYAIYDYLLYQSTHNQTAAKILNSTSTPGGTPGDLIPTLRNLASKQLYAINSNVDNDVSSDDITYLNTISSISGATTAMAVLNILQDTIRTQGSSSSSSMQKLSVFMTEFDPFLGFAASSQAVAKTPGFAGLPGYGATMGWELYSLNSNTSSNTSSVSWETNDLYVRFVFRNGSDDLTQSDFEAVSYPLFDRDPDQADMQWADFVRLMGNVAVGGVEEWCGRCEAQTLFCVAVNSLAANGTAATGGDDGGVSNVVAGVIGAAVTIAALLLIAVAAVMLGGVRLRFTDSPVGAVAGRFTRNRRGGATNGSKFNATGDGQGPSDKHESLQSAVTAVDGAAERRGKGESWEMRNMRRHSMDDDPIDLGDMGKPVEAIERV